MLPSSRSIGSNASGTTSNSNRLSEAAGIERPGNDASMREMWEYVQQLKRTFGIEEEVLRPEEYDDLLDGDAHELIDPNDRPVTPIDPAASAGMKEDTDGLSNIHPEREVDRELLRMCQGKLRRRMELIHTLRRAYLTDVILLKKIVDASFTPEQAKEVQAQWAAAVPSLDTRELLWLHAPEETSLGIVPCNTCGGCMDVMHHDSPEIERLNRLTKNQAKGIENLRLQLATQRTKIEQMEQELHDASVSHQKEKHVMQSKMRELRLAADETEQASYKVKREADKTMAMYEELKLATTDYTDLVLERDQLRGELDRTNAILKERTDDLGLQSERLSEAVEEVMGLKKTSFTQSQQIAKQVQQIEELEASVAKAARQVENAEERAGTLQQYMDELRNEYQTLEAKNATLQSEMEAVNETSQKEVEKMEFRLDGLKNSNNKLMKEVAQQATKIKDLEERLETAVSMGPMSSSNSNKASNSSTSSSTSATPAKAEAKTSSPQRTTTSAASSPGGKDSVKEEQTASASPPTAADNANASAATTTTPAGTSDTTTKIDNNSNIDAESPLPPITKKSAKTFADDDPNVFIDTDGKRKRRVSKSITDDDPNVFIDVDGKRKRRVPKPVVVAAASTAVAPIAEEDPSVFIDADGKKKRRVVKKVSKKVKSSKSEQDEEESVTASVTTIDASIDDASTSTSTSATPTIDLSTPAATASTATPPTVPLPVIAEDEAGGEAPINATTNTTPAVAAAPTSTSISTTAATPTPVTPAVPAADPNTTDTSVTNTTNTPARVAEVVPVVVATDEPVVAPPTAATAPTPDAPTTTSTPDNATTTTPTPSTASVVAAQPVPTDAPTEAAAVVVAEIAAAAAPATTDTTGNYPTTTTVVAAPVAVQQQQQQQSAEPSPATVEQPGPSTSTAEEPEPIATTTTAAVAAATIVPQELEAPVTTPEPAAVVVPVPVPVETVVAEPVVAVADVDKKPSPAAATTTATDNTTTSAPVPASTSDTTNAVATSNVPAPVAEATAQNAIVTKPEPTTAATATDTSSAVAAPLATAPVPVVLEATAVTQPSEVVPQPTAPVATTASTTSASAAAPVGMMSATPKETIPVVAPAVVPVVATNKPIAPAVVVPVVVPVVVAPPPKQQLQEEEEEEEEEEYEEIVVEEEEEFEEEYGDDDEVIDIEEEEGEEDVFEVLEDEEEEEDVVVEEEGAVVVVDADTNSSATSDTTTTTSTTAAAVVSRRDTKRFRARGKSKISSKGSFEVAEEEEDLDEFDIETDGLGRELGPLWSSILTDLKESLKQNCHAHIRHSGIRRVLAALLPTLKHVFELLVKSHAVLWRNAKASKLACDFVAAAKPVAKGLAGTMTMLPDAKQAEVESVYSRIIQQRDRELLGEPASEVQLMALPSRNSNGWASRDNIKPWTNLLNVDIEVVGAMTDASGKNRPKFSAVNALDFFGQTVGSRVVQLDRLTTASDTMNKFEENLFREISKQLDNILELHKQKQIDVSTRLVKAETELSERIEAEAARLRRIAAEGLIEIKSVELDALVADRVQLRETLVQLANISEREKKLIVENREQMKELILFEETKVELAALKREVDDMHMARIKQDVAFASVSQDKKEMAKQMQEGNRKYEQLKMDFDALSDQNIAVNNRYLDIRMTLAKTENELSRITEELDDIKRKEFDRLNRLEDKGCQHIPDPSFRRELGIQTEFMVPPMTLRDRVRASVLTESVLSPHRSQSCDILAPVLVGTSSNSSSASTSTSTSTSGAIAGVDYKAYKPLFPKVSVSFDSDMLYSGIASAAMARPVRLDDAILGNGNSSSSNSASSIGVGTSTSGGYSSTSTSTNGRAPVVLTYETFLPRLSNKSTSTSTSTSSSMILGGPSKRNSPLIPTFHDGSSGSSTSNNNSNNAIGGGTDNDTASLFGGPSLNSIDSTDIGPSFMHMQQQQLHLQRQSDGSHPIPANADVIAKHKRVSQLRAEKAMAKQQHQMQLQQQQGNSRTTTNATSTSTAGRPVLLSESLSTSSITSTTNPALSSMLLVNSNLQPAIPPGQYVMTSNSNNSNSTSTNSVNRVVIPGGNSVSFGGHVLIANSSGTSTNNANTSTNNTSTTSIGGLHMDMDGIAIISPRPQSTPLLLSSRLPTSNGTSTSDINSNSNYYGSSSTSTTTNRAVYQLSLDSIDGGPSVGDVFDS